MSKDWISKKTFKDATWLEDDKPVTKKVRFTASTVAPAEPPQEEDTSDDEDTVTGEELYRHFLETTKQLIKSRTKRLKDLEKQVKEEKEQIAALKIDQANYTTILNKFLIGK